MFGGLFDNMADKQIFENRKCMTHFTNNQDMRPL